MEAKEKFKGDLAKETKKEVSQMMKSFNGIKEELARRNTDLEKDNMKLQKLADDKTAELNRALNEKKEVIEKLTESMFEDSESNPLTKVPLY